MAPTLAQVVGMLDLALAEANLEELPALAGRLREAELLVELRLRSAATRATSTVEQRNLSAKEAARRLGVSLPYLYKHAHEYPFTVRIGKRVVFDASGLEAWNRGQRVAGP